MKAFEFCGQLAPDSTTLTVPAELAAQLPPGAQVRVLLLVPEDDGDAAWARLTTEQFFKGYDDADAVYDHLPGG
jgi:hypothetical protein